MAEADDPVKVRIFNQQYPVRGGQDADYVEILASYVDGKMREISTGTQTVDSLKVAVLAALNIADELFQARDEVNEIDRVVSEKSQQCVAVLDQFLKP